MGGDIRATGCVADVLHQFFFPTVWTLETRVDDDLGHRQDKGNETGNRSAM